MAITYLNRMVVVGPPARIRDFRATMHRTLNRSVAGKSWQEEVPFSL